jgi:hypothetical protein
MTKMRPIPYAEMRAFLKRLGLIEKRTPNAFVFFHPTEGLVAFPFYRDDEPVAMNDVASTRRFLDYRGILDADDFEATLLRVDTPA